MYAFIYLILNVSILNVSFSGDCPYKKMPFFFRVSDNKRKINPDFYKNEGVYT